MTSESSLKGWVKATVIFLSAWFSYVTIVDAINAFRFSSTSSSESSLNTSTLYLLLFVLNAVVVAGLVGALRLKKWAPLIVVAALAGDMGVTAYKAHEWSVFIGRGEELAVLRAEQMGKTEQVDTETRQTLERLQGERSSSNRRALSDIGFNLVVMGFAFFWLRGRCGLTSGCSRRGSTGSI